jgi:Na+/proline symporter
MNNAFNYNYTDNLFAQVYGAGGYDTATYGGSSTSTTTGTSGSGALTNTGIAVASIVTIAAVLLLVAMAVRIWRRPNKQAIATVDVEDDQRQD